MQYLVTSVYCIISSQAVMPLCFAVMAGGLWGTGWPSLFPGHGWCRQRLGPNALATVDPIQVVADATCI